MTDQINPPHYRGFSNGAEVIDIVENLNFNRGNAVKYLSRAGRKSADELTDLRKAKWYVEREIARLEKVENEAVEHSDSPGSSNGGLHGSATSASAAAAINGSPVPA